MKLHLCPPITGMTAGAPPPARSAVASDSRRNTNPNLEVKAGYPEMATKEKKGALGSSRNLPRPHLWKNCLPRNQSRLPESAGNCCLDITGCGQGQLARVYVREHHRWPEPSAGRRGGEKRGGLVFLRTGGWPRRGGRILLGEAVGARFF